MDDRYTVRRFQPEDAEEVSALIARTLRTVNSRDYSEDYIESIVSANSSEKIIRRGRDGHLYVVCDERRIVGCGAIDAYEGRTTESILLSIFVLPEYQGRGIGARIMRTLEGDEFFLRADRIELHASITAVGFYKKMGYDYKDGIAQLDDDQVYRMEKLRPGAVEAREGADPAHRDPERQERQGGAP